MERPHFTDETNRLTGEAVPGYVCLTPQLRQALLHHTHEEEKLGQGKMSSKQSYDSALFSGLLKPRDRPLLLAACLVLHQTPPGCQHPRSLLACFCRHALADPSQGQSHMPGMAQGELGLTQQDSGPWGRAFLAGLSQVGGRQAGSKAEPQPT